MYFSNSNNWIPDLMDVIKLKKAEFLLWDEFIVQSPQYSLFAHTWYLEALGVQFEIYIAKEKDQIKGGIVLPRDKWGYYINPVLCKYLGVYLFNFDGNKYTIESRKRKVSKALLATLEKLPSFEYTFHPDFGNWMTFRNAGFKQTTSYTYRIDLDKQSEEALLSGLNARLRNKILHAQQSGCKIEEIDSLEIALPILKATYESKGNKLPFKEDKLLELFAELKKQEAIHLSGIYDKEQNLLAVLGLFYDKKTAYLILNGTDERFTIQGINELLIFAGINWAKKQGLRTFDFEGSMIPSIESFYRQFGGTLTPYHKIWMDSKQRSLRNLKQRVF